MKWEKVRLGDCCEITSSKRIFFSEYVDLGIPFFRSKEIIELNRGEKISEPLYISAKKYDEIKSKYGIPQEGDMLLTSVGTIGVPYIVKSSDTFYFKDGNLTWFRNFNKRLLSHFLFYWIGSDEGYGVLNNSTIGSSQKALTISSLKQITISLPPVSIQKNIVNILSNYDALIENNQKQIKLLEEAAQRLYKEWFVDLHFPGHENTPLVDGLPEGWKNGNIASIAFDNGKHVKKTDRDKYECYLPIDSLPKKSLAYLSVKQTELAESSLISFEGGDILFGAMRPYFHKVVVARHHGLTRTTCFVINSLKKAQWSYLLMVMFSEKAINFATTVSVGTTMPYVRWEDFIKMPIIIPSDDICEKFNKIISLLIVKVNKLAEKTELLQEARERLLPKLMNGEIEV